MPRPTHYTAYWSGQIEAPESVWYEYHLLSIGQFGYTDGHFAIKLGPLDVPATPQETIFGITAPRWTKWTTVIIDTSSGVVITRITAANQPARTAWLLWQKTTYPNPTVRTEAVEDRTVRLRQEAARRMRALAFEQHMATQSAKHAGAERNAAMLLLRRLDSTQREELATRNAFKLISQTGKRYLLGARRTGNVVEIAEKDGQEVAIARYCAHSTQHYPLADDMLLAFDMLHLEEAEFLRVANRAKLPDVPLDQAFADPLDGVVRLDNMFARLVRELDGTQPDEEPEDLPQQNCVTIAARLTG